MQIKRINLALQGGGAHGAYTWGVLDRLLEDRRIKIEAISGTSASTMNAVMAWATALAALRPSSLIRSQSLVHRRDAESEAQPKAQLVSLSPTRSTKS